MEEPICYKCVSVSYILGPYKDFLAIVFASFMICFSFRFLEKTFVTSGGQSTKPLFLLTNDALGVPVFDNTQNELVNKVRLQVHCHHHYIIIKII